MSHCKVISVFTIVIALIGWVVLYIVIGQEFLKSVELVTPHLPSPGCRKGSTKKHVITPALTQPSTRKTNGSSEGPASSTLKFTNVTLTSSTAIPPQNELTTQELSSEGPASSTLKFTNMTLTSSTAIPPQNELTTQELSSEGPASSTLEFTNMTLTSSTAIPPQNELTTQELSSEGPASSTLKFTNMTLTSSTAIPPQNELTTQELASNDGLTSTIDTPASSPPNASPGSNDAEISDNDLSLVTGKPVKEELDPIDIHKATGHKVFMHPFMAIWRILLIIIEVLR